MFYVPYRRAQLKHCLEQLKEQVPLSSDSTRNTTLNLLRRAQLHIKVNTQMASSPSLSLSAPSHPTMDLWSRDIRCDVVCFDVPFCLLLHFLYPSLYLIVCALSDSHCVLATVDVTFPFYTVLISPPPVSAPAVRSCSSRTSVPSR